MSDSQIERVARAIHKADYARNLGEPWAPPTESEKDQYRELAEAIDAMRDESSGVDE